MDIIDSDTEGFQNSDIHKDGSSFITPSYDEFISVNASSPEGFLDHIEQDSSRFTVESNDKICLTVNTGDQSMPEDLSHAVLTVEHHNKKTHEKESKKYHCYYKDCLRTYNTKGNLKSHQKKHTGEYNFICTEEGCGKQFLTSYNLKIHVRIHTKEKPHVCNDCDKRFTTLYRLTTHRRSHTGEMMKCDFDGCIKEFNTNSDLKKHKRIHTGERPYHCEEEGCGKTFVVSHHLKKHIQTHASERPYLCTYMGCYKAFASSRALKYHLSSKHKELQEEYIDDNNIRVEENQIHREETNASMEENASTVNLSIVAEQPIFPTVDNPCPYILKMHGQAFALFPLQTLDVNPTQPIITTMLEDMSTQVDESSFDTQVTSQSDDTITIPVQDIISTSAQMAEICNCPTNQCQPDGRCCQGCPSFFCHDMGADKLDTDPDNSSFSIDLPDAPTEPISPSNSSCTAEASCQTDDTFVEDCCGDDPLSLKKKCTKGSCGCCGSACG